MRCHGSGAQVQVATNDYYGSGHIKFYSHREKNSLIKEFAKYIVTTPKPGSLCYRSQILCDYSPSFEVGVNYCSSGLIYFRGFSVDVVERIFGQKQKWMINGH